LKQVEFELKQLTVSLMSCCSLLYILSVFIYVKSTEAGMVCL